MADITNSVLAAYIRGAGEKKQAQDTAFTQQKQEEQLDLEKQRIAEEHQQHLDLLDRTQKEFDATQARNAAQHKLDIQQVINKITDEYVKSGTLPGNAKLTNAPEDSQQQANLGGELGTIDLPNREDLANKQANIDRITGAPKEEFAAKLQAQKEEAAKALNDTKIQTQQAIKEAELNATARENQKKIAAAYDLQILKNHGSADVANINAAAGQAKLAKQEAKLSTQDSAKLQSLSDIERNLVQAKDLLDKSSYDFFQGPFDGTATAAKAALSGESRQDWSQVKNSLGAARQAFVTANEGKTLSQSEIDLIDTFLVDPKHTLNANDAKTSVESLLQRIQAMKGDVYAKYSGNTNNKPTDAVTKPSDSTVTKKIDPNAALILQHVNKK